MSASNSERVDVLRRRGVFAGAIASIAALVVGRSAPAAAATEPPPPNGPLIGGTKNMTTSETVIEFVQDNGHPPDPGLCVNQGPSMGMLGGAPVGEVLKRFPTGDGGKGPFLNAAVAGESQGQIGTFGYAGPDGVGVWGASEGFVATWGASNTGIGVLGQTYSADIAGHEIPYPSAGVLGVGGGSAPGTWGAAMRGPGAWGQSLSGPGVLGQTGLMPGAAQTIGATTGYPQAGVYGVGGDKVGIWGAATSGMGAWGQSDSGIGVIGQTGKTPAGAAYPVAGVLGVDNTGGSAGTWGLARNGGVGAWGQSADGVGVAGQSDKRIGAWFKIGPEAVDLRALENAAVHTTAFGANVSTCARAERGIAVEAMVSDPAGVAIATEVPTGGIALRAEGRLLSNMIMLADIPKGVEQFEIPCNLIYEGTHVSIQVRSDVGAAVTWVDTRIGKAVIVHFDRKTKAAGTLSYALTERFSEMGGPY